jgi:hypothetical protein
VILFDLLKAYQSISLYKRQKQSKQPRHLTSINVHCSHLDQNTIATTRDAVVRISLFEKASNSQ